jgi:hypothetical protein
MGLSACSQLKQQQRARSGDVLLSTASDQCRQPALESAAIACQSFPFAPPQHLHITSTNALPSPPPPPGQKKGKAMHTPGAVVFLRFGRIDAQLRSGLCLGCKQRRIQKRKLHARQRHRRQPEQLPESHSPRHSESAKQADRRKGAWRRRVQATNDSCASSPASSATPAQHSRAWGFDVQKAFLGS